MDFVYAQSPVFLVIERSRSERKIWTLDKFITPVCNNITRCQICKQKKGMHYLKKLIFSIKWVILGYVDKVDDSLITRLIFLRIHLGLLLIYLFADQILSLACYCNNFVLAIFLST